MSRIGRKPVVLPTGVTVTEQDRVLRVTGPKGKLSMELSPLVRVHQEGVELSVERTSESREGRAHHGLTRNLIANMVKGVSEGFERKLIVIGVGYKAEVVGNILRLNLGYSNPIEFNIPEGIEIAVDKQKGAADLRLVDPVDLQKITGVIKVRGIGAQEVGQVAANIRAFRSPDTYKGKGIRYEGEHVKKKPGKAAAT